LEGAHALEDWVEAGEEKPEDDFVIVEFAVVVGVALMKRTQEFAEHGEMPRTG
jgi:hypothetical protein